MTKEKVVIGLSGGVDSAVAALLLKKEGYNVIGAFMKCFSDVKNLLTGECNWVAEKQMAQRIAAKLGIKFVMLDFEKEYTKFVIKEMYKAYSKGLTPNPDIVCNTLIKFPLFWKHAKKLGADKIAMGHYARIMPFGKKFKLLAGKDKTKDQSYFLYELSQKDLSHTLFPIGNLTKEEVRKIAKKAKLPNWDKKGTRGVCFIGKVNFQSFLRKKIKGKEGNVIDSFGNIIGKHNGTMFYTLGQRIGSHIGIEIDKPHGTEEKKWYVAAKLKNNVLVAAPEGHGLLKKKEVFIANIRFVNKHKTGRMKARIRHLGEFHNGVLKHKDGRWKFVFDEPVFGISPGQAIVFYLKDEVAGGGEIRLK
jgi:tRNA-specific 2-thiouridylase